MDADGFLADVVDAAGDVDYNRTLEAKALDDALAEVAAADLDAMGEAEAYAFLINAYNLCTLDVARRVLLPRGRSLRNKLTWLRFFLGTKVRVAGLRVSLYTLEFKHIKPHLVRDPRGHFALVCASTGCPPLRGGVYHGDTLDAELTLAAKAFIRPGAGYAVDRERGVLWLNRIFKWYRKDFAAMGGIETVFCDFAAPEDAAWFEAARPRTRFLKYDWGLNASEAT